MIRCISCGKEYDDDEIIYNCTCGSILEVETEVEDIPRETFEIDEIISGNTKNSYQ